MFSSAITQVPTALQALSNTTDKHISNPLNQGAENMHFAILSCKDKLLSVSILIPMQ